MQLENNYFESIKKIDHEIIPAPTQTIPTIGFNVNLINYKNNVITLWDVGGQDKIRTLWSHYYFNTNGVIYVIDSSDIDRLKEANRELNRILNNEELNRILNNEELNKCPILILAINKIL